MNKQPFYHRATLLFTGTKEYSSKELKQQLRQMLVTHISSRKVNHILLDSIEIEECDVEPGDPADLL